MIRFQRNLLITIVFLIVFISLPGYSAYGKNRADLRIGYVPILTQLPLITSHENDRTLYRERGIELIRHNSFTSLEAAMRAGAIDIASIPVPIALRMITDGEKITIIGTCHTGGSLIVTRKKGSLDSIRGQLIGLPGLDSNEAFSLNQVLAGINLHTGLDYKTIEVPFRIALDDLKADKLDALFLPEPYGTMAEEEGTAFAVNGQDELSKNLSTLLVVRSMILDKKRASVKLWLSSIVKSCRFIETDIRETGGRQSAIIQKAYFDFPKQIVSKSLVQKNGHLRFNRFIPDLDEIKASLELSIEIKMISKSISLDDKISFELMNEAIK